MQLLIPATDTCFWHQSPQLFATVWKYVEITFSGPPSYLSRWYLSIWFLLVISHYSDSIPPNVWRFVQQVNVKEYPYIKAPHCWTILNRRCDLRHNYICLSASWQLTAFCLYNYLGLFDVKRQTTSFKKNIQDPPLLPIKWQKGENTIYHSSPSWHGKRTVKC